MKYKVISESGQIVGYIELFYNSLDSVFNTPKRFRPIKNDKEEYLVMINEDNDLC